MSRSDDLPPPIVASLAHDAHLAVAVASRAARYAGLGVDTELEPAFDSSEAAVVLRDDDLALPPGLAFVVKEAVYKAVARRTGLIGFHDVHLVAADHTGDGAIAHVVAGPAAGTAPVSVRWTKVGRRWLAVAFDEVAQPLAGGATSLGPL